MKILTVPNPVLESVCSPVDNIDKKIRQLANDLVNTLANRGVGLAAPQIGKKKAVFIIGLPEEKPIIFINPQIISHSHEKQFFRLDNNHQDRPKHDESEPFLEGCLSIPHLYGAVKRWPEITAQWLDLDGKKQRQTLTKFKAIVFQHELDHLNGQLFTQRIAKDGGQLYRENDDRLEKISF
jgi:peptide deformylase